MADIFETLRPQDWCKGMSDAALQDYVREFYTPPYKFSRLVGIEVRGKYDGVSYWECPDCKKRWDRFTGKEVQVQDAGAQSGASLE